MPKITPARPDAHAPHDVDPPEFPPGWCLPCYEDGQAVLAASPDAALCQLHQNGAQSPLTATQAPRRPLRDRPPRSSRSLAYGRRRAGRRVAAGRFAVHPGWRHRVPAGRVVLTDQPTALARTRELVDDELWRADRRRAWLAVLGALVAGMDWRTGLVTGVTRQQMADRAAVSTRTVSRVLAWAEQAELLVCVETGATAAFLGTERNRAPAYVLTRPTGSPSPRPRPPRGHLASGDTFPTGAPGARSPQRVDLLGNPPASCVREQPLGQTRGLKLRHDEQARPPSWPSRDRARTPAERTAATRTLLERVGLAGQVPLHRAHGLLTPWWKAGACVAALLHAIDHHPDRPAEPRGDALRSARDPLRVLGYRLAPWRNRLAELPPELCSGDPDQRRAAASRRRTLLGEPSPAMAEPAASPAGRARARALYSEHRRRRATGWSAQRPTGG